jgi:hypothetical protein
VARVADDDQPSGGVVRIQLATRAISFGLVARNDSLNQRSSVGSTIASMPPALTFATPVQVREHRQRRAERAGPASFRLAGPGGFHELERGLEQLEILLVIGCLGAVDLNPLLELCR